MQDSPRPASEKAIPEREAWLHANKSALASVILGLKQSANGEVVDGPDLEKAARLLDELS